MSEKEEVYISKLKIDQLKKELQELEKKESELAGESGKDMAYSYKDAAATDVSRVKYSKRIIEIKEILKIAKELPNHVKSDSIVIGSWVKVFIDGFMQTFRIVDPIEADPSNSSISYKSPLGALIMGREVGDIVKLPTGKNVEIKNID